MKNRFSKESKDDLHNVGNINKSKDNLNSNREKTSEKQNIKLSIYKERVNGSNHDKGMSRAK